MTTQSTTILKGSLAAAGALLIAGLCMFYIDYTYRFIDYMMNMTCSAAANASQYLHNVPIH